MRINYFLVINLLIIFYHTESAPGHTKYQYNGIPTPMEVMHTPEAAVFSPPVGVPSKYPNPAKMFHNPTKMIQTATKMNPFVMETYPTPKEIFPYETSMIPTPKGVVFTPKKPVSIPPSTTMPKKKSIKRAASSTTETTPIKRLNSDKESSSTPGESSKELGKNTTPMKPASASSGSGARGFPKSSEITNSPTEIIDNSLAMKMPYFPKVYPSPKKMDRYEMYMIPTPMGVGPSPTKPIAIPPSTRKLREETQSSSSVTSPIKRQKFL